MTDKAVINRDPKLSRKPSTGLDLLLNWEQKQLQKQTSPSASESEAEEALKPPRAFRFMEPPSPQPEEEEDGHESDSKKHARAISISSPTPSTTYNNSEPLTIPTINITQEKTTEAPSSPVRQHTRLTASAKKHTRSRSALEQLDDIDMKTTDEEETLDKREPPSHSNSFSSLNLHSNGTQSGYTTPNMDMSPSERRKNDPHRRLALLEVEVERLTRKLKSAEELHKREAEQYQARLLQEVEKKNQAIEEQAKLHRQQLETLRKEKDITISFLEQRIRQLEKVVDAKGKRSNSFVTTQSTISQSDSLQSPKEVRAEKQTEKSTEKPNKENQTSTLQLRRSNSSHSEPTSPELYDDRPTSSRLSSRHRSKTVCFTDDTNLPTGGGTRSTRSNSVGNEEDQNWSSLLRSLSQVETNPTLNLVLETRSQSSATSDQDDWNSDSETDRNEYSDNDQSDISIPATPTSPLEPSDLQDKPITLATQQKHRTIEHSPSTASVGSTGSSGSRDDDKKKKKRDWRKSLPASLNLKAEKERKEKDKNRPSTLRPSYHSSFNDTDKIGQLSKQKSMPIMGNSPPTPIANSNTIAHQPTQERTSLDRSAFLSNPFNTVGRIFAKSKTTKSDTFEPDYGTGFFGKDKEEKEASKKAEGVFGFPLDSMALDSETGIPIFLIKLTAYLQHVTDLGLFTECSDPQELKQVRELCQSGVHAFNFINVKDDSVMANLLYNFLDELPDPVFTYGLHPKFLLWNEIDDEKFRITGLRSLVNSLPATNRKVSDHLINFFRTLVSRIHKVTIPPSSSLSAFLAAESRPYHAAEISATIQELSAIFGSLFLKPAPPTATTSSAISHAISTLMTGVNTANSTSKVANNASSVFKLVFMCWEPSLLNIPIVRNPTSPRPSIGSSNDLTQIFQATDNSQDIRYILKDGIPVVYAASVDRLLEKTLDDFYRDIDFVDIVFITHPYFIVSAKLLERFVDLYNSYDAKKAWQARIRLKILENTKVWVTNYSEDLKKDPQFVATLKQFITKTIGANKPEETLLGFFRIVLSVMETNTNAGKELRRKQSQKVITNLKIDVQDLEILDIDHIELAEQITLIDHDLLKAITPHEFLHKNFDSPKSAPFFNAMVNKFNEWTMWVVTEVLKKQKPNTRAMVVAHFIKVAQKCREYNNFHSCYAIIAGLNYSAVSRLKLTWEKVPRKQMLKYKELCDVFDMSHNFKNYRDTLLHSSPPIVPYLGLIPKDLTSLEELPNVTDDNLVNFDKMRTLRKILMQIREYQLRGYAFTVLPELATFLKHLKVITKDQAFKMSLEREPRKTN